MARAVTITGGRDATQAVIPGDFCLSVGLPERAPPLGWSWRPLTSIARLESGHTPSRKHPEYWSGDIPWIGIRDATGNHGQIIYETNECTNPLGIANSSARLLPADTVCLSRTASVGYVVVMGRPMATSQDFVNWICSSELNPHFLKYALLAETRALRMFAVGSVHPTIYFPEVKALHICAPHRDEQDNIVSVLKALDDKIELNRRMNETLEAMVRTIFKDWFVDFGPTRAKMEGRASYLAPEIWAMFPARMDADNKPEGWSSVTVEDVAAHVGMGPFGSNIKVDTFVENGVPIISGKHLTGTRLEDSTFNFITEEHASRLASSNVERGDIVFTHAGNIGQVAIIPDTSRYERYIVSQRQFYLRCNTAKVSALFAVYFFKSHEGQHKLLANASQVGVPSIARPVTNLKAIQFVLPTKNVLDAFDAIVKPVHLRAGAADLEVETLTATRNMLLPKLMSGEIRLRDVEKAVEAVV